MKEQSTEIKVTKRELAQLITGLNLEEKRRRTNYQRRKRKVRAAEVAMHLSELSMLRERLTAEWVEAFGAKDGRGGAK